MTEKGSVFTDLGDELSIAKEDEYFRYEYDLLNRLERVYSLDEVIEEVFVKSYVYNASGMRILAEDAEGIKTHYTFDTGGKVVEKETDDTIRNFFYLGSKVVAHKEVTDVTSETLYYGTDHLGSSVLMTDATGATVWTGAVTPFADAETTEGLSEHVMFTGKELDTDTGLYYYNARWYDPSLGRFITEDPVRDGSNWFIYVNNSPLVFIDPTGLEDAPFNTQTGPIPTIKEVETGDNWYNNVFDTFAAGAAGILNWGASLGNMAIGGLAGIGEGIEKLDNAIPDKHSLTGMGQVEDLNAIALYLGMNPAELAMAMQGLKNIPSALAKTGKSLGKIETPYGDAVQSTAKAALNARGEVEGGATLYRIGTTGKSAAGEAQFWSLENSLSPGYASKYGLPAENIINANFIETATLKPGASFVTRPAPGIGTNLGGGIEVVLPQGGVNLQTFSTLK